MKKNKIVLSLILCMTLSTVLFFAFIIENIFSVLDQASTITIKPIKSGIKKEFINIDIAYGNKQHETLDIYKQQLNNNLKPVFIFIPGGLWQGHNKKNYSHIAGVANRNGYTSVILNYPYYAGFISRHFLNTNTLKEGEFNSQKQSFLKAITWIQKNIHIYGGNPNNITFMAFDSGAHILLTALLTQNNTFVNITKKIILLSPILDIMNVPNDFKNQHITPIFKKELICDNSPLCKIDILNNINIPILLLSPEGEMSFLQEQAQIFSNKNKNVTYKIMKKTSRRSIVFRLGRRVEQITTEVNNFIK